MFLVDPEASIGLMLKGMRKAFPREPFADLTAVGMHWPWIRRRILSTGKCHGRSSQPWQGNDMNTYADDLAELFGALGVSEAMMIGHSTGGGEVARHIGRHVPGRVSKVVLMGAVTPIVRSSFWTSPAGRSSASTDREQKSPKG